MDFRELDQVLRSESKDTYSYFKFKWNSLPFLENSFQSCLMSVSKTLPNVENIIEFAQGGVQKLRYIWDFFIGRRIS